MNKDEISRIANRYSKKAQNNYMKYQESGVSRYLREYEQSDDIVNVCIMAMAAEDDHYQVGTLKAEIVNWACRADKLLRHYEEEDVKGLLRDIRAMAKSKGWFRSIYSKDAESEAVKW